MKIDAAVLDVRNGPLVVQQLDLQDPRADEVLVHLKATGVCHSDISVIKGDLPLPTPIVLGHEGAGVVQSVGSAVTTVKPGDHVVLTFASCGSCGQCLSGHPVYCDSSAAMNLSGTRVDGSSAWSRDGEPVFGHFVGQSSFGTHVVVHHSAAIPVDPTLPLEHLAPLGCGVQTGAGTVFNTLHPPYGSTIAVTGAGSVGLSAVMAASVLGCRQIIAVDVSESRLRLAQEVGATDVVHATGGDLTERLRQLTDGRGVNYIVDTTGLQHVVAEAFAALSVRGTLSVVGVSPAGTRIDLDPWSFLAGRTVQGNMEGDVVPSIFIPFLIDLYRQGRFPFDKLITVCHGIESLADVVKGQDSSIVKAVVTLG
ncbi:MAG: alcohol dehydrogenase [Frankiales bacterium]|jgi:aryl-alcohol dehydrogenase|nr:alcohol dehydrogenase [Frankiales bacterium]